MSTCIAFYRTTTIFFVSLLVIVAFFLVLNPFCLQFYLIINESKIPKHVNVKKIILNKICWVSFCNNTNLHGLFVNHDSILIKRVIESTFDFYYMDKNIKILSKMHQNCHPNRKTTTLESELNWTGKVNIITM